MKLQDTASFPPEYKGNPTDYTALRRSHLAYQQEVQGLRVKLEFAEMAMRKALNWCTGEGEYSDGRDNMAALAEEVAPALSEALNSIK